MRSAISGSDRLSRIVADTARRSVNDDFLRLEIDGIVCSVKVHARSKHVRLKMVPYQGLVAVVPPGYERKSLDELLVRHREWICNAAERFAGIHGDTPESCGNHLPQSVRFFYSDECVQVGYECSVSDFVSYREESGDKLFLSGKTGNTELCRAILQLWLKHKAARLLFPELSRLASLHGFCYKRPAVRLQKSRWGSCSTSGTITLNAKLLFLPPHLVRSVLLHELCHTVHMNHSPAFRKLLESCDTDSICHDIEMKTAFRYVPAWAALPS